ncbi:MAG: thiamine pyrophosphate-dependent dehydrogenase E1 component subunit alpha [Myxococcales bacterium]|nr:thiamine pyrophosphate-dependent dehydrogenase E1 component subunit alpha [Myxococcales bacterium]
MKRYPAFEFPEYVDWRPDPAVQAAFSAKVTADAARAKLIGALDDAALLDLYRGLCTARLHDVQLKRWVKQGVITKAWLGSGEEAVTVGGCAALGPDDVCGPMIRNAAALIERGVSLRACFAAYLGTTDSITGGRDLHIGDPAVGVIPPISHVGDLVPVMAGCALAFKLRGEPRLAITWVGDGSTATGAFHEGMRMAASAGAPLICVVQNNQVALGTRTEATFRGQFADLGPAYGVPTLTMDGNHVLDCYAATRQAVDLCRAGQGPVLIVTETFRMGGHATHDEREARDLFDADTYTFWGKRDPIGTFEHWLMAERGVTAAQLAEVEAAALARVDAAAADALARRETAEPDPATQADGVYA